MSRKKILVAEPDKETLRSICGFFHQENFDLLSAQDGPQAFRIVEEQDPELVVLAQDLPLLSGLEICCRIKADPLLRRTVVVLVCREESPDTIALCRSAGCDACLSGPPDRRNFIETVRQLLGIPEPGRIESRFPVRLPARFKGPDGQSGRGMTVNVSASGLYLETQQLFPRENRLRLFLQLSEEQAPVSLLHRVAWVNHPEWVKNPHMPTGMGLDLVDRASDDARLYAQFVARLRTPQA